MRENRAMPFASKGLREDKTGAGLGSCFLANPRGGALVKMYRYKGISNPKDLGDKNANNL